MKSMRVLDIILPLAQDVPLHPNVQPEDSLSRAIELMVLHDLQQIVVVSAARPIGVVNRRDAFQRIGLRAAEKQDT